jgi:hypothetical protein
MNNQSNKYLKTNLILFGFALTLSILFSYFKQDNHLLILTSLGGLFTVLLCSILNLFYFLPKASSRTKFILPGMLSILILFIIFRKSITELIYFELIAFSNLLIGMIWVKKNNNLI